MESFDERRAAAQLKHFDSVWRRVSAGRRPEQTAGRCGVELMPRRGRCCGKRRR